MNSPYVADKNLDNISSGWTIPIGKKQYLDVFIWETESGLLENTGFRNKDYLGCYIGVPGRKPRSGLLGEIHLVLDMIGAGYVAHEIAHAVYDFMVCRRTPKLDNEYFALITGGVTAAFWKEFYGRYEVKDAEHFAHTV